MHCKHQCKVVFVWPCFNFNCLNICKYFLGLMLRLSFVRNRVTFPLVTNSYLWSPFLSAFDAVSCFPFLLLFYSALVVLMSVVLITAVFMYNSLMMISLSLFIHAHFSCVDLLWEVSGPFQSYAIHFLILSFKSFFVYFM